MTLLPSHMHPMIVYYVKYYYYHYVCVNLYSTKN